MQYSTFQRREEERREIRRNKRERGREREVGSVGVCEG